MTPHRTHSYEQVCLHKPGHDAVDKDKPVIRIDQRRVRVLLEGGDAEDRLQDLREGKGAAGDQPGVELADEIGGLRKKMKSGSESPVSARAFLQWDVPELRPLLPSWGKINNQSPFGRTLGMSSVSPCRDFAKERAPRARSEGESALPWVAATSTSTNGGRRAATSVPRWSSAATTTATTAAGIEAPALRMSSRLATASGTCPPLTQYSSTRLIAAQASG